MKILIVDDEPVRYKILVQNLLSLGVERSEITISGSSFEAREKLESIQYDLLILDLLIPGWPEEEPDEKNSEDLLIELNESAEGSPQIYTP